MAPKVAKAEPKHPRYQVMITDAIKTLKERNGSSAPAIAKFIKGKYEVPPTFGKTLSTQLKNLAQKELLVKVKASYKLSDALKKPAPKKVSKPKKAAAPGDKPKKTVKKSTTAPKKAAKPKVVKPKAVKPKKTAAPKVKKVATKKTPKAKKA